jgi:hypothetical protein
MLDDKSFLNDLAKLFDDALRDGSITDTPEGSRTITIIFSDTLANELSQRLKQIGEKVN